jgi:3-oxoacid CoA-transferase subunit B
MNLKEEIRHRIARRAAREIFSGAYVNLGIVIPSLITQYLDPETPVTLMSESGLLGMSSPPTRSDPELINAAKECVSILPGGAFFSSDESFAMIRGGHIDLSILGAFEVDEQGNLANWMIPGKMVPGMGGAMDLAVGARRIVVAMTHTTSDHHPKILRRCTLPLTAVGVVNRIITEMAVLDVTPGGLLLKELAPQVKVEEVARFTGAEIRVDKDLRMMN